MGLCEIILEDRTISIPRKAWTHNGFRSWAKSQDFPARGRISFIAGRINLDLCPDGLNFHNAVKCEFLYQLMGLNKGEKLGMYIGDGVLFTNLKAKLSHVPNAMFFTWKTYQSHKVRFVPCSDGDDYDEILGSPDIVIEVVNFSSHEMDKHLLRAAYHDAEIPEYWLVDAQSEKNDFQILHHGASGYSTDNRKDGWQYSAVFNRNFRLERGRLRFGLWDFDLKVGSQIK